ncbi:S-adenosyl-L-methionine-dependent methyltransferases superfamily protein [Actinidia rufa]|uniref:S-adenosyl-L-methionine-dependent methyltransferases superfamily protein n=1 Tax=Actinidia rufa TaxID=165716 RepID=A0A7J0H8J8_9ERIC|nr:S-adenosyl-L-methionine-dependent methyltransferases superfamily protein [Actinidia rufa]
MNDMDGLEQVVLLTDGMDTRPYRLSWPTSTIMFDVSPARVFTEAAHSLKSSKQRLMDKLYMGHDFRVNLISYNELANKLGRELAPGDRETILFVTKELRFSDDEMETWRREFERIEEEGDEEGFEEL